MVTEYSFRSPWLMSVGLIWCQDAIHQLKTLVFLLFLMSEYDTIHDSCVGIHNYQHSSGHNIRVIIPVNYMNIIMTRSVIIIHGEQIVVRLTE
jgi:hypothetical protein